MESYDCIIIGGGIIGLSAAWNLVHEHQKKRILLLDQFPFPNSRNSSSGHTRIFRNASTEPMYVTLSQRAVQLWREIETLSGKTILHSCGVLYGGGNDTVKKIDHNLSSNALPYERLSFLEVQTRWPQYQNFHESEEFIFDPCGGFLRADTALQALRKLISEAGDIIHDQEKVLAIYPSEKEVRVQTEIAEYRAETLIMAAGPWNIGLMAQLGVQIEAESLKVSYWYFKVRTGAQSFHPSRWPVTIYDTGDDVVVTFPSHEFPGLVKTGIHLGVPADPDTRDKVPYPKQYTKIVQRHLKEHLPQLENEPSVIENCMYTDTPDTNFILDRHPRYPRLIVGAGFSGRGFKMGPAIGQILAKMALNKSTDIDISQFRLNRSMIQPKL